MSVDIHCGTDIGLSQKLLHILRHCPVRENDRFKNKPFLRKVKEVYTNLINRHIENPEQRLKVFDKNSVYLPTKKTGKNNPNAEGIQADNAAKKEWERTADMALISGIEEARILEIKGTGIPGRVSQSIRKSGWLPNRFHNIVSKAKVFPQGLIRQREMPPKPTPDMDMAKFPTMGDLMIRVQDETGKTAACERKCRNEKCSLPKQRYFQRQGAQGSY